MFDYDRELKKENVPNKVNVSITPIGTPTTKLRGYSYVTNSTTTDHQLSSTTATSFEIANFRDPKAAIFLYGGGTGTITTSGGRAQDGDAWISSSYKVSVSTFEYPSSGMTVTVTPSKSSGGGTVTWLHYDWNVRVNSDTNIISNINNNISPNSNGSFKITIPWNTKWTGTPKVTVYCQHLEATVAIPGHQVYGGFRVNKQGYGTPIGVTGWSLPRGQGEKRWVVYDDYPDAEQDGSYYCCTDYYGRGDAWVGSDVGEPYYITEPGYTVELEYYG